MINRDNILIYTYKVYGLIIRSEIMMTELTTFNCHEDIEGEVIISYGIVPKDIEGSIINGNCLKLSKNEMYFYVESIAHFYVANGNTIIVEPEHNSNIKNIKLYLLGGCLGMILTQRNIIGIHGGSIVINGKGIIIAGHTGAGKSTLTTAFRTVGYPFLSDDISALGKDNEGNIVIYPSYPQQKLCRDTIEKMGFDADVFNVIDAYRDKYLVPIDFNFLDYAVPLDAIYEINVGEGSKVEINRISGSEKIKVILRNIYGIEISRYIGFEHIFFKQCIEIARNIQAYRITRPKDIFTVNEQMEIIRDTLK